MIQQIEERALNAWPGLRQLMYDGWLLRFTGGYTRRANSISLLYTGCEDLTEKIAWCEAQYTAQQLPTVFKLLPMTQPERLDDLLAQRGYRLEAESQVLYAPLADVSVNASKSDAIMLSPDQWLAYYADVTGSSHDAQHWHEEILRAIIPAACPAALLRHDEPVAVGLGVLERGMVGIYDLVTEERYRRQGLATQVISTILSWAATLGAHGTYLQVMADNAPALALYAKMGYRPCYRYWYRVKECDAI